MAGCGSCGKKKCNCPEAIQGPIGLTGPQGLEGQKGPKPKYEWNGTQIRFENPDCSWGPWVDLVGPPGPCVTGGTGGQGTQGPAGPGGPQGTPGVTGPQGNPGADGVSVTNAAINGAGDLIITLSNGSTINAGSVTTPGGGGTDPGFNQPFYLFKATSITEQAHTGGNAPGTIVSLPQDSGLGHYDYGDSWSGNDWELEAGPVTLRFQYDQLQVRNDSAGATGASIVVALEHSPFAGVPVIIATSIIPSGLAPAAIGVTSAQSANIVFSTGDKVRLIVTNPIVGLVILPGTELWNMEV